MKIVIDKACPDDAAEILDYLKKIGQESDNLTFGAEGLPFTVEQETEYLKNLESSRNSVIFVARDGNTVVGDASLSCSERERLKHHGELGISVLKEYWGNGIGSKLMQKIIDFARNDANAEILFLNVRSDNHRAISLYKKFGFKKVGILPGYLKINGQLIDCDYMCLVL